MVHVLDIPSQRRTTRPRFLRSWMTTTGLRLNDLSMSQDRFIPVQPAANGRHAQGHPSELLLPHIRTPFRHRQTGY